MLVFVVFYCYFIWVIKVGLDFFLFLILYLFFTIMFLTCDIFRVFYVSYVSFLLFFVLFSLVY